MATEPYLLRLTAQLADGLTRLPAEVRDRHAAYLCAADPRAPAQIANSGETETSAEGTDKDAAVKAIEMISRSFQNRISLAATTTPSSSLDSGQAVQDRTA